MGDEGRRENENDDRGAPCQKSIKRYTLGLRPSLSHEGRSPDPPLREVDQPLAGLRTHERGHLGGQPTFHRFPIATGDQCFMTGFVFIYRCGAVPDLHQVPSCRPHENGGTNDDAILSEPGAGVKKNRKIE